MNTREYLKHRTKEIVCQLCDARMKGGNPILMKISQAREEDKDFIRVVMRTGKKGLLGKDREYWYQVQLYQDGTCELYRLLETERKLLESKATGQDFYSVIIKNYELVNQINKNLQQEWELLKSSRAGWKFVKSSRNLFSNQFLYVFQKGDYSLLVRDGSGMVAWKAEIDGVEIAEEKHFSNWKNIKGLAKQLGKLMRGEELPEEKPEATPPEKVLIETLEPETTPTTIVEL